MSFPYRLEFIKLLRLGMIDALKYGRDRASRYLDRNRKVKQFIRGQFGNVQEMIDDENLSALIQELEEEDLQYREITKEYAEWVDKLGDELWEQKVKDVKDVMVDGIRSGWSMRPVGHYETTAGKRVSAWEATGGKGGKDNTVRGYRYVETQPGVLNKLTESLAPYSLPGWRVNAIARTEHTRAMNRGLRSIYDKDAAVAGYEFSAIIDMRTCFPAGTLIATSRGDVPIERVEVGDSVLTHLGRWRSVTDASSRSYSGQMTSLEYNNGRRLRCTSDHPILIFRNGRVQWLRAAEIKVGDYAVKRIEDSEGKARLSGVRENVRATSVRSPEEDRQVLFKEVCFSSSSKNESGNLVRKAEGAEVQEGLSGMRKNDASSKASIKEEIVLFEGVQVRKQKDGRCLSSLSSEGEGSEIVCRAWPISILFEQMQNSIQQRSLCEEGFCENMFGLREGICDNACHDEEGGIEGDQGESLLFDRMQDESQEEVSCLRNDVSLPGQEGSLLRETLLSSIETGDIDRDCDQECFVRSSRTVRRAIQGGKLHGGFLFAKEGYRHRGGRELLAFERERQGEAKGPRSVFEKERTDRGAFVGRPHKEGRQRSRSVSVFEREGFDLIPIDFVASYRDDLAVYNFTVQDDHSYVAEGIAVHNCPECGMMHETVLDKDDPRLDFYTPPVHVNAVAPGTLVETMSGPVPVEDVLIDDMVLTHRGRYRKVYQKWVKVNDDDHVIHLNFNHGGTLDLTSEHPILTEDGWKRADELERFQRVFRGFSRKRFLPSDYGRLPFPEGFNPRLLPDEEQLENIDNLRQHGTVDWCRIVEQREHPGFVFNLAVRGDETFVASGQVVHNCRCELYPVFAWEMREATFDLPRKAVLYDKDGEPFDVEYVPSRINPVFTKTIHPANDSDGILRQLVSKKDADTFRKGFRPRPSSVKFAEWLHPRSPAAAAAALSKIRASVLTAEELDEIAEEEMLALKEEAEVRIRGSKQIAAGAIVRIRRGQ